MKLTVSVDVPESLYEKAKYVVEQEGETIENVMGAELFRLFAKYWSEKSKDVTREEYLSILKKGTAPPEDEDKL
ncbi:MAG: hypothetical protein IAF08_02025 [Rhizobacter sp.]|nr:hypothetical protein [Chlorobiales bacterium]